MQAVRLSTGNPWKGTTDVFNRGDPSLAIMAAAIAAGLRDYAPESLRPKETYFRVGGVFLALNTVGEILNLLNGMELSKELEPGQIAHFLLTPIWGAFLGVPLFDLLFHVEGKRVERFVAIAVLSYYIYTLVTSMSQGSLA
ncbi:MAG: hypothetical protein AAB478_04105 [Patescibacteria group bacterium]